MTEAEQIEQLKAELAKVKEDKRQYAQVRRLTLFTALIFVLGFASSENTFYRFEHKVGTLLGPCLLFAWLYYFLCWFFAAFFNLGEETEKIRFRAAVIAALLTFAFGYCVEHFYY